MMKKKLVINAAMCDVSHVSEQTLQAYDRLEINAAVVVSSSGAREKMAGLQVKINAASTLEAVEGATVSVQNGTFEIKAGQKLQKPAILIVNGKLTIEKGAQESLKDYLVILVNGQALYPNSMAGHLGQMNVNGSSLSYPDEAILLGSSAVIDRVFILRARDSLYFAQRSVVLPDKTLDIKALREKGARFLTKKAVIAEALLEEALPLFEDEAEIVIIPEGLAYVKGSQELREELVRMHGARLYIDGDLHIPAQAAQALEQMERCSVSGEVKISKGLLDRFLALAPVYKELSTYRGTMFSEKSEVRITPEMMDRYPDGMTLEECAIVKIDSQIAPETIEQKLCFEECGMIFCSPAQRSAVEHVSSEVGMILDREPGAPEGEDQADKPDLQTEVVNAASYTL
jgi:hypothetical protein